MDLFFIILSLFGGLALFLFGMNIMGEGLKKTAGGKLELLLEKLSSTPLKAMLLGAAVTAVIQSSSATTVMVVGFVNSGIMKLSQAIGIILGANVGTTITSWILSLSGVEGGDIFILRLLGPTGLAPILGIIGAVLYVFINDQKKKDIGSILLGLSVLLFGMEAMSEAVSPLAELPAFTNTLLLFSNPFLGFLVGTVVTCIIQSSSASIGILQALSLSGTVTFGTAIPIIMGQNLGTCITAMLSSMGAKTNARRAASVHLYYNIIIVGGFMIIFYTLNSFINFKFLNDYCSPFTIACFHTIFNVIAFIIFAPFTKQLEKLVRRTIRGSQKEMEEETMLSKYTETLNTLDERFLKTPALAVNQCVTVCNKMVDITRDAVFNSFKLCEKFDEDIYNQVDMLENVVDIYEDRLGTYIVKLSQKNLSEAESNKISIILHSISNLERISDHAMKIATSMKKMEDSGLEFTEECQNELNIYMAAVKEILGMTCEVFKNLDVKRANDIEPLEEVIDNINERIKRHHVRRMSEGLCSVDTGVHLNDICNDLERISDRCSNIGVAIIEINDNVYDTHEYLDILKNTQSPEFQAKYHEYNKKFHIEKWKGK